MQELPATGVRRSAGAGGRRSRLAGVRGGGGLRGGMGLRVGCQREPRADHERGSVRPCRCDCSVRIRHADLARRPAAPVGAPGARRGRALPVLRLQRHGPIGIR